MQALLFDLDGVLTRTATLHSAAWKQMFDDFLAGQVDADGSPQAPFSDRDYDRYVDGRPQTLQAFAVREALSAARRGHRTVLVDLPRTPDRLIDEVAARCDRLVLVTVASVVGVAASARIRARFSDHPGVGVVVRGEELAAADVARAVRAPVLAQMREQRGVH